MLVTESCKEGRVLWANNRQQGWGGGGDLWVYVGVGGGGDGRAPFFWGVGGGGWTGAPFL